MSSRFANRKQLYLNYTENTPLNDINSKCVTKAFTSSRLKSLAQIKKPYGMKNPLSWWIQQNKFLVIFSNKGFEIWIFEMYVSRWLCFVNPKAFAFKTKIFFWYGLWQVLNSCSTKQSNQFHTQKQSLRKETNKKATISTKTYLVKIRYRKINRREHRAKFTVPQFDLS